MFINIILCFLKFNNTIDNYEKLLEVIENIDNHINLNNITESNINDIYNLSQFICYEGKFQNDIIDLKIDKLFSKI